MTPGVPERLLVWWLGRFYRLFLAGAALGFGLLWAVFGLGRALLITLGTLLGWLVGKWLDEGRPDGGLSRRLRRLFEER